MALDRVETRAGAARRHKRLEEEDEQLLPGIPNEISVDLIAAKFLSWKDICTLSSVSRGWCLAVRNREVYRARVRSQSKEVMSGFKIGWDFKRGIKHIVLRSTRDYSCSYQLPQIPGFTGLPLGSQLVPLDRRIFVMGGLGKSVHLGKRRDLFCSDEVYVLDLAGRKQWKPCARMKQARGWFAWSELDGKIYVFGGVQRCLKAGKRYSPEPACGSEMYDPKENTWKSIKASPNLRFLHVAVPIGPELVVYNGFVCPSQEAGKHLTAKLFGGLPSG